MRLTLFACVLFLAAPASAALAPQYYQAARDEAADVVVIDVRDVDAPPPWVGHGECVVEGVVAAVERGAAYTVGQAIKVTVPCMRSGRDIPAGAVQWKRIADLRAARAGRAFLNGGALALYQYDILP
jgi:hypothetical protein